jgi:type IV pilus assembly protein PilA
MVKLINKLKNRKGFTLIELIVVLAVLAVIMAIAVPRFMGVQEQSKKDADISTLGMIAKTAELYYIQGKLPNYYTTTATLIKDDSSLSENKTFLTNMKKDLPNLKFQTKTAANELGDATLLINTSTGKATVTFNGLTNK